MKKEGRPRSGRLQLKSQGGRAHPSSDVSALIIILILAAWLALALPTVAGSSPPGGQRLHPQWAASYLDPYPHPDPDGSNSNSNSNSNSGFEFESERWFVPSPVAGTISEALELAQPGDEIIIDSSYDSRTAQAVGTTSLISKGSPELFPLRVEKPQLKISCETLPRWDGSGGWTRPRIFAPADHAAVVIAADGVTMEGCAIKAKAGAGGVGIVVLSAFGVKLSRNLLSGLREGICLINTAGSVIRDNLLTEIEGAAIHLESSEGNLLEGNRVRGSGEGLLLVGSQGNEIRGDTYENNLVGLHLEDSSGNLLEGLTVAGSSEEGLLLVGSDRNRIMASVIAGNRGGAIALVGSDENEIIANRFEDNGVGPIMASAGELVAFTTPVLSSQGRVGSDVDKDKEEEDPYAEARQERAKLQEKLEELEDRLEGLEQGLIGMLKDVRIGPARTQVQTPARRLEMDLQDALNEAAFLREASIPLGIEPLLGEIDQEAESLKGKELGPKREEILEELEAFLQLLGDIEDQLARLKLILDDGEREADPEEFDDVVDWLEEALSFLLELGPGDGRLEEALEWARKKLEAALIQTGRAELALDEMEGHLAAISEKLPPPPPSDLTLTLKGRGIIAEIVVPSTIAIPEERLTQLEGELTGRLESDEEVLLEAERLGLLPLDIGDIELKRRPLPAPRGNLILGNFGEVPASTLSSEAGMVAPWRGEHLHLFGSTVKIGCPRSGPVPEPVSESEGLREVGRGACPPSTEVVVVLTPVTGPGMANPPPALTGVADPRLHQHQQAGALGSAASEFLAYPNPTYGETVRFIARVQGGGQSRSRSRSQPQPQPQLLRMRVKIFDLAGREIFDSGWQPGAEFEWRLRDRWGEAIASGVYLYVLQVRSRAGAGGLLRSEVGKLVVLRS